MAENDPKSDRFSLRGMSPEDAIRKMFATQEPKTIHCPKCGDQSVVAGLLVVDEEGNTRCPQCGRIASNERNQS